MNCKKVHFNSQVLVYLIPYYKQMEDYKKLWWNLDDIFNSRKNAQEDINELLRFYPNIDHKKALYLLYQP